MPTFRIRSLEGVSNHIEEYLPFEREKELFADEIINRNVHVRISSERKFRKHTTNMPYTRVFDRTK